MLNVLGYRDDHLLYVVAGNLCKIRAGKALIASATRARDGRRLVSEVKQDRIKITQDWIGMEDG